MKAKKKNVLIIVENLPVPFDTRVWKESCALKENGYNVSVICPKGKGFEKRYELLEGIHIYRHPMPKEGNNFGGYLIEYILALIWEFALACWIFMRRGFNVIQGCNPPDNIFLIALLFRIFGVKYIFDHHDVNPELYYAKFGRKGLLYKIQLLLERLTFMCCDVVMSTNQTYREIAISRGGIYPENVFVVRNGPETDKFKPVMPVPKLKFGKKYLVGYVGTMSVQEGIDFLLEVALYLKNKNHKDIHFTCIGGGPGLDELETMKQEMGLDSMFNFTGRIPDKDLLEILSTADVCVNPDRLNKMNDISTMIKIMEYMALGKPIIQFDLKEGKFSAKEASLYVKHERVEEFAEKILWLIDHPEERKKMGEFARKRAVDDLAWKYSVPCLLKAYERAFDSKLTSGSVNSLRIRSQLIYYQIKPFVPRAVQLYLRSKIIAYKRFKYSHVWPITSYAGKSQDLFAGWPENKKFAVALTHDVETKKGHAKCLDLAELEQKLGFRSSFHFVPERYNVDPDLRNQLVDRGFEIGIHGLNHDGRLYKSYNEFLKRAKKINRYIQEWDAVGFRSPSMHHNLEWIRELDIKYDSSTFDTDPFEPQPDGVGTIFPFCVSKGNDNNGYVELPLTMPQDFTLFVLMKEGNIDIWKKKLDWIAEHGGMVLMVTHPDYMSFNGNNPKTEEYPAEYYEEFLEYLKEKYEGKYWHVLPKEMALFWSSKATE